MTEFVRLSDTDNDGLLRRCEACQLVYGRPQKHNETLLRCGVCDFPFGATLEGLRAIAMGLQHEERTNVYGWPACFIWLKLVRDGWDLDLEEATDTGEFGVQPEWLDRDVRETGWDTVIGPAYKPFDPSKPGASLFTGTWNDYALVLGVAPNQPFLVQIAQPRWHKCSYEYEEWEAEYDWEVIVRDPRSPRQALQAWNSWRRTCIGNRAESRSRHEFEDFQRTYDIAGMYLKIDCTRYNEKFVRLYSDHGNVVIASGQAEFENDAWQAIRDDIKKRLPHLPEGILDQLPRKPLR